MRPDENGFHGRHFSRMLTRNIGIVILFSLRFDSLGSNYQKVNINSFDRLLSNRIGAIIWSSNDPILSHLSTSLNFIKSILFSASPNALAYLKAWVLPLRLLSGESHITPLESHCLRQFWPRSICGVTGPHWITVYVCLKSMWISWECSRTPMINFVTLKISVKFLLQILIQFDFWVGLNWYYVNIGFMAL